VSVQRLIEIMARLRDPQSGCPWDLAQDWQSIVPHTIEEAYEVAEAVANGDPQMVRDELGDLLFQVVFQSRIAEEGGLFNFDGVADSIAEKLLRRHPHVFGDARIPDAEAQTLAWEEHKRRERVAKGHGDGALDGVTLGLPALTRAAKLGQRASRAGFDWTSVDGVMAKVHEEIAELEHEVTVADAATIEEELGDLLFATAQLARHLRVDPEAALRRANAKFERRFRRLEGYLAAEGRRTSDAGATELDALWERAKKDDG
jgi:MazG family protein